MPSFAPHSHRPTNSLLLLQVLCAAAASSQVLSRAFQQRPEGFCTSLAVPALPARFKTRCAQACLQTDYCVAYIWNRLTGSCQLLPRLLESGELAAGPCLHFVDVRCFATSSSCPADFTLCLPRFPGRRFLIPHQLLLLSDHIANCRARSGELAEFPGRLNDGMRDYFPIFRALLRTRLWDLNACSYFSDDNIHCQAFIGARMQPNKVGYYWVRNGSKLVGPFNVPGVVPVLQRQKDPDICFDVRTNVNVDEFIFELKDQINHYAQLGICECLM